MRYGKRDLIAIASRYGGITRLLRYLPEKPVLLVLNYHRIGDPDKSPYDFSVFSATEEAFDEQLRYLKRRVHVATIEEAVEIVEGANTPRHPVVLLTFDDGYLDNYQLAFPILSSHSLQATFFLPTAFIGTNWIAWWDIVAYIVKGSKVRSFTFGDIAERFDLASGLENVLYRIYAIFKRAPESDWERLFTTLEDVCQSSRPGPSDRSFMNWDEAIEMARGGMAIGSHTHNHAMLGKLPGEEQYRELVQSKEILESRLGAAVSTIAYPNGSPQTFNAATFAAAEQARYRAGFSFYGGVNCIGSVERFNVRRLPVGSETIAPTFELQTTVALLTGKGWLPG